MTKLRTAAMLAGLALIVAACTGDTTDAGDDQPDTAETEEPTTPDDDADAPEEDGLEAYGESTDADPALIEKALGPVGEVPDIVLAAIARAEQDLDDATIDKAMECFNAVECDTGTGGEVIMGYADGGGLNVWRQVTRMEAILQALTYPDIGTIVFRAANFDQDPAVHINDIRFLINRGVDFIIGYPDMGILLGDVIKEATAADIPYISFSAGWVGLSDQEGALVPGTDYLSVVGEDLCALGESFAEVLNDGVGSGKVALLGGTPNNALSLGWQRCTVDNLGVGLSMVNAPANRDTTAGDTYWFGPLITAAFQGLLAADADIKGWAYEYADGMYIGLNEFEALNIPVQNQTMALRTDEQNLFCEWKDANEPTWNIWYSAGGNFQTRIAVTAAMINEKGGTVPAEIVVPHVMRQVTADDCRPDPANAEASGTSLVPDSVMRRMFTSSGS